MNLFEAIDKRHSYRAEFTDEKIPVETLKKIVQTGIQAPSGKNAQSTEFIIINNNDLLNKIADIIGYAYLHTAPAMIVVLSDTKDTYFDMNFYKEDYAAAVENILLSATALGYASLWIDGVLRRENKAERITHLLNIPDTRKLTVLLPIGRPLEQHRQKEKKPFEERAWFNHYKNKQSLSI